MTTTADFLRTGIGDLATLDAGFASANLAFGSGGGGLGASNITAALSGNALTSLGSSLFSAADLNTPAPESPVRPSLDSSRVLAPLATFNVPGIVAGKARASDQLGAIYEYTNRVVGSAAGTGQDVSILTTIRDRARAILDGYDEARNMRAQLEKVEDKNSAAGLTAETQISGLTRVLDSQAADLIQSITTLKDLAPNYTTTLEQYAEWSKNPTNKAAAAYSDVGTLGSKPANFENKFKLAMSAGDLKAAAAVLAAAPEELAKVQSSVFNTAVRESKVMDGTFIKTGRLPDPVTGKTRRTIGLEAWAAVTTLGLTLYQVLKQNPDNVKRQMKFELERDELAYQRQKDLAEMQTGAEKEMQAAAFAQQSAMAGQNFGYDMALLNARLAGEEESSGNNDTGPGVSVGSAPNLGRVGV